MKKATNKRRIPSGIGIILLLLVLACGITLAYMFAKSGVVANRFTEAAVSCEVNEAFDGTVKSDITVSNTGNIPAYIRVRLVSYWVDSAGEVIAKTSEIPSFTLAPGWVSAGKNTYCYSKAVAAGAKTLDFLADGTSMTLREENGCFQVVEIIADAIQSKPAKAVTESWKVTVDARGVITG